MIHLLHIHAIVLIKLKVQLDELEPLFEPQPILFSFNTPAWYILGGLLLLFLSYMSIIQIKKYKKNRYRRDGLKLLNSLDTSKSKDINSIINQIRILLKQLAIRKYGRQKVASLYGEDWLKFLESKGKDTPFLQNTILINQATFLNTEKEKKELMKLVEVSRKWIKTHA